MSAKDSFATEEFPLDQIKHHLSRREGKAGPAAGGSTANRPGPAAGRPGFAANRPGSGSGRSAAGGSAAKAPASGDPLEAAALAAQATAASALAQNPELAVAAEEGAEAYRKGGPIKADFFDLPPLERVNKREIKKGLEVWKILFGVLICLLFAMGSYFAGQVYGATLIPEGEGLLIDPETGFTSPIGEGEEGGAGGTQIPKILTVLLMGVDQRDPNELARADVAILASMNLDTKEIDLISIPRDTRAAIAGTDVTRKINYAHATGGAERMKQTVENLLGVNVHYYVEVNFKGFSKCIDLLGGVNYNVERRMYLPDEGIDLMPGQQKLTGDKALQYVRWRGDPTADIGRIGRQQKFLEALMKQAFSVAAIPKLPGLVSSLMENLTTDMTAAQMVALATEFSDMSKVHLETVMLPGDAKTISGASYWVLDEAAVKQLIQEVFAAPALDAGKLTGQEAGEADGQSSDAA